MDVIDLGDQVITSRFPVYGDWTTPKTHICLFQCRDCGLVQLRDLVSSSELYEHMYGYRSGINPMMIKHLKDYNTDLQSIASLQPGDAVLDIGSNDATFLQFYPDNVTRVGCDPTGKQFASYYEGLTLVPDYFTAANIQPLGLKFKAVSSISMFYDLPDPVQFARDIHSVLADDGVWTLEQSYILTMLERNSIDTICHEHVEYYALRQIKKIMDLAGFVILKLSRNDCNGGSFRIFVSKTGTETPEVAEWLAREKEAKLDEPETYYKFKASCEVEIEKLKTYLAANPSTYVYGASTKGNCLLQFANITEKEVPFAVERNLEKVGKMTCTGIPIISEETMRSKPPANLLVLPWHFKEGIIEREKAFLNGGGKLLFPFPTFEIVARPSMESFSQAGQDKFPQALLHRVTSTKTYLDIGCHHPTTLNNSYALERAGWKGLSVDILDFSSAFRACRKDPFIRADVTTVDWESIITKHFPSRVIDFISFDVDDATRSAFANFPFWSVRFKTMTFEHDGYRVGTQLRDSIRNKLSFLGYTLVCADVIAEGYGAFEDWWVDLSCVDDVLASKVSCTNTPSKSISYPF